MKKTIRIVIIIIAALLLCALATGALVWLNYEGANRDLGYGMILRPYDLEGEDARRYKIDVYDLSGKIKTPTDNGDLDLGERTATVSWEDTIEFILIDHAGEHDGLLEMLRSNYWEKLGSFKYDKVIVINDEIRYFVNTRKGVMYTYVVHNDTPIGWGIKPLSDRQIEILGNGDTFVTDNITVTEDTLPAEPEITTAKTYDICRYVQSSEFLAVIYNDVPYYYSDNIYDPQELAYYLSQAEYVGQVESDADENPSVVEYFLEDGTPVYAEQFPTENFQSNCLEVGTKLYVFGDYMIAEFAEPWDNSRIVYGQVMMPKFEDEVESGNEIVIDIELPSVEVEPEPEIEVEVEAEEEPALTSDPGAEEISLDREPIYSDVEIIDNTDGTGVPMSYDDLAKEYLEIYENLRFIEYEITKVYTPEQAYSIMKYSSYRGHLALYQVHITYDHVANCELDEYVYMSHSGNSIKQFEGMPAYAVGDRFVSVVIGNPEDRIVPIDLEYAIYEIDGVEYAYFIGNKGISIDSDDPDLDLPMSASEKLVITTTENNPVRYTQKSTLESVIKFIREDWSQRGIGLSFPKSPDVTLPWKISKPAVEYWETMENRISFDLYEAANPNGAEFKMLNGNEKPITTGNSFVIEIFKDGEWHYIDIGIKVFPAEAFVYESIQSYDISIDWTNYYGELVPGKYRLIKEYSIEGSSQVHYAICEFIIRE